jgi:3'(2'), 5'-bisphosphate nucleotidase
LDPRSDAEFSRDIAVEAGVLLMSLRESYGQVDPADRGRIESLRAEGDRLSHELLASRIAEFRPNDALLSEEGVDDRARLTAERVWIVDPLDGTREFGEGRSDFAVHVALWDAGAQQVQAATVDLPGQATTRSMLDIDPVIAALPTDRPIRLVASRSRAPKNLADIVRLLEEGLRQAGVPCLGVEVLDVGSVGAKVNELLSGRAEAYVHDTGFYEWDVAAPYGVAQHYGFSPSHWDGNAVVFNQMPPYVANLVVAHPDLLGHLRKAMTEAANP